MIGSAAVIGGDEQAQEWLSHFFFIFFSLVVERRQDAYKGEFCYYYYCAR